MNGIIGDLTHKRPGLRLGVLSLALGVLASTPATAGNLHLIESLPNGFAIYRSGMPDSLGVVEYCRLGITEIAVLAGNASDAELKYRSACSGLKVVYDLTQSSHQPLTPEFLAWFDSWVERARREGTKIAIRCQCGCHRTGRLAAYYQMKYQRLSLDKTLAIMYKRGKNWHKHGDIEPQVRALKDYLDGKPCSQSPEYCTRRTDAKRRSRPASPSGI